MKNIFNITLLFILMFNIGASNGIAKPIFKDATTTSSSSFNRDFYNKHKYPVFQITKYQTRLTKDYSTGKVESKDVPVATGTGFFINEDGFALTNNHVVHKAKFIKVTTIDNKEYDAQIIGVGGLSGVDVAVIKINMTIVNPYGFLKLGDSNAVEVGDILYAIGYPLGIDSVFTTGIRSGPKQPLPEGNPIQEWIITDVTINPGNSGGPLLNEKGEVVGINSASISKSGLWDGIGLVIGSNLIKRVASKIMNDGKVITSRLLSQSQKETTFITESGISVKGIELIGVDKVNNSAHAGLLDGDIILSINGKALENKYDYYKEVMLSNPNSNIELRVARGKVVMTILVMVSSSENVKMKIDKEDNIITE